MELESSIAYISISNSNFHRSVSLDSVIGNDIGRPHMLDKTPDQISEPVHVHFVDSVSIGGQLAISTPLVGPATARNHPVLFFHGATVPSQFTSEYKMDGTSWMGQLSQHGWQVFGLDLPGYGRSSRYPEPEGGDVDPRVFGSAEAVQADIAAAVDWILNETGTSAVHVIAISRGAIPAGYFAAAHAGKVRSLTFHAPITKKSGIAPEVVEELLGSREIPSTDRFSLSANDRFRLLAEDRPEGTVSSLETSFVENWVQHYGETLGNGSDGSIAGDRPIATPIGFAVDIFDAWHGRYFEPAAVISPFLLLRGDWDRFLTPAAETQGLFEDIGAAEKYYVQFPRATHSLLFEEGRREMYSVVETFLSRFD